LFSFQELRYFTEMTFGGGKTEKTWLRGRDLNPRPSGYEPDDFRREVKMGVLKVPRGFSIKLTDRSTFALFSLHTIHKGELLCKVFQHFLSPYHQF